MYQAYYNLSSKPFRLSPDPGFFFPSRGHKRALAYLRYGLNQDEGFVVITGSPGTGKTTLAKILLTELGDKDLVVAHLTTTQLDADDMLRMVAASFGLNYEGMGKAAILKSLEQFLMARAREGKRALLVIDEAQNLPAKSLEELRMLSNLQAGDKALVQTFLLGQAQFRQMLDNPDMEQLRQRVIANYHLSPLAPDECQRYIESRLQHVGWDEDPSFAEIAYEMVHEYTEGIPRRINMLCDRVLLFSCMEELHTITAEVVKLVTKELEHEISGDTLEGKRDADTLKQLEKIRSEQKPVKKKNVMKPDAYGSVAANDKSNEKAEEEPTDKPVDNSAEKPVDKPTERDNTAGVLGNTAVQKELAPDTSNDVGQQSDINERDLFRVIPGGKPSPASQESGEHPYKRTMTPAAQDQQPSQEDVVLRRILRLVLAFHRSPSRFPGLDNAIQPLPDGITDILELAVSDDQVLTKVSPAAVMGISPMMLRAAVRFFVRRAFFVVDGDDYRVLGLQTGASQQLVERHYDLVMRLLRQDKQRGSADSVARIGSAYEALNSLDQSAQHSRASTSNAEVESAVEEEIEVGDDDITIDFEEVSQQEIPNKSATAFGRKPYQTFNPETFVSQRRLRRFGQVAIFGFGALVIVLGLYIMQIEPVVEETERKDLIAEESISTEPVDSESKRLSLSFTDGSTTDRANGLDRLAQLDENIGASPLPSDRAEMVADFVEDNASASSSLFDNAISEALNENRKNTDSEEIVVPDVKESAAMVDSGDAQSNRIDDSKNSGADDAAKQIKTVSAKTETGVVPQSYKGVDIEVVETNVVPLPAPKVIKSTSVKPKLIKPKPIKPEPIKPKLIKQEPPKVVKQQKLVTPKPVTLTKATQSAPKVIKHSPVTKLVTPIPRVAATKPEVSSLAATQPSSVAVTPPKAATNIMTEQSLNQFVERFVGAYKKGDINKVMALFARNARTNNRTTTNGIRVDYVDLFRSTSKRDMDISSLFWEFDENYARGVGEYRAQVSSFGTAVPQIFVGKITMQIQKQGNELLLTRFYFSNQNVVSESQLNTPDTQPITAIELQTILTTFAQGYASGDIEKLLGTFAEDARTNDQSSLAGIRKDHEALFASTSSRQMTISDMEWQKIANAATGAGNFEVVIKANGSDIFQTYTGAIKIQVKRTPKGVLITQMIHNTQ